MGTLVVKRGDIFLINTNYDINTNTWITRPFLVIQNNVANEFVTTVIVIGITSKIGKARIPTHVELPREVSGLEKDSVVLAENISTYDKRRLKAKIGEVSEDSVYMLSVEKAMRISTGRMVPKNEGEVSSLENNYKSYVEELTKPIIITEGKTDARYLRIAWKKLYPNREMYFECNPSGLQIDEDKRTGSSSTVRQALQNLSTIANQRIIIGLFDNDRCGNTEFNSLENKKIKIFEQDSHKYNLKKHIKEDIWGMLLPVPEERELFVTPNDMNQRYFSIEHYFSDEILREYNMCGNNILCTSVFEIKGDKNKFSDEVEKLDAKEFANFKILFDEIENVIKSANPKKKISF